MPTTRSILATDLYQLTMAAGYFHRGLAQNVATCELFIRRLPSARRYLVALGIDAVIDWLLKLRFSEEDIDFLRQVPALAPTLTPAFVDALRAFRFTGDVWALPEGTIAFEHEPFLRVRAPIIEAQILETFALSTINHATTVGSKAARVVSAAQGRKVVEFGTRRTHPDAAIDAARAAYAAGIAGTSNVEAARRHGIPVLGTAAHMWTMAHPSEESSFQGYFSVFPDSSILLVDTYDTPRGALRAAKICRAQLQGVRLDSGDLDALSREVRAILDREGASQAKIVVSGDLNEHSIAALVGSGAPIDTFGVGTELVCSVDAPTLSGVYKLVELFDGTASRPVAKFSEGKGTLPGPHQIARLTSEDGQMLRDIITLEDEEPLTLHGGERSTLLLRPAIRAGVRVQDASPLSAVRERVREGKGQLPPALHQLGPWAPEDARYSVRPSGKLAVLVEDVRARFASQGEKGESP